MAEYKPSEGQLWELNGKRYRIKGIRPETGDVSVEILDENDNVKLSKNIPKKIWCKRDYVLVNKDDCTSNKNDASKEKEVIPEYSFTYDPSSNKFSVYKDGKIVTDIPIITVNGHDGQNAYELWANRLPKDTKEEDKTFAKFQEIFKGHNGKDATEWTINEDGLWCRDGVPTTHVAVPPHGENGKDAYEVWRDSAPNAKRTPADWEDFIKGKDGKTGQSAFEAWKSLNPKERENATLSDFFNWLVEQTEKKIDAKEGASWIPNIVDGKVVFVNNRTGASTDEYPVKGKDGKTYKPIFIDGKIVFIDDDGHEITPRHEYRGKSAFEVWREMPGNETKTEKDFFEFLKGEKGDTGADGIVVEAKHSYLDIKDWTCPVQTIDTDLIINLSGSGKSPDSIIEDRMNEINNLRKEGDKLRKDRKHSSYFFFNGNWWYEHWAGWFKEFSWWCAGADRSLLRMCPSDHSKYTGIGTVILFTALMAWFSSYMAMRLVFDVDPKSLGANLAAISFATFWALMIFFLDRFITNTMYSDGEVTISRKEFVGGLPRILIAIFLGIVISAPLELKIFEQDINMQLLNDKETFKDEHISSLKSDLDELCKNRNNVNSQIKQCGDNQAQNDRINKRLEELSKNHQQRLQNLQKVRDKECGLPPQTTNQKIIDGYITKQNLANDKYQNSLNEEKISYDKDKARLEDSLKNNVSIEAANLALEQINRDIKNKNIEISKASLNAETEFNNNKNGLKGKLVAMHTLAMKNYEGWQWTGGVDKNKNGKIDYDEEAFFGHLLHSWWDFLFLTPIGLIMLLFILIDISPVLYKMMLADGVYDNYMHQEKLLKQDKIRLSLARMVRKIDKGEMKALSPFIMGKIYRKLSKYSVTPDGKYEGNDKDYKKSICWGENIDELDREVEKENHKIFEIVLEYKRRIILASYAAWYRDMRDALIGSNDDEEGKKINTENHIFNDANFENSQPTANDDKK